MTTVLGHVAGEHDPPPVGGEPRDNVEPCIRRKRGHAPDVGPVGVHHVDLKPPRVVGSIGIEGYLPPVRGPPRVGVEGLGVGKLDNPRPVGIHLEDVVDRARVCGIGIGASGIEGQFGAPTLPHRPAAVRRFARQLRLVGEVLIGYPSLHESGRVLTPENYAAVVPWKRSLRWWWCDQDPRGPSHSNRDQGSQHKRHDDASHKTHLLSSVSLVPLRSTHRDSSGRCRKAHTDHNPFLPSSVGGVLLLVAGLESEFSLGGWPRSRRRVGSCPTPLRGGLLGYVTIASYSLAKGPRIVPMY